MMSMTTTVRSARLMPDAGSGFAALPLTSLLSVGDTMITYPDG
jgi:hypothetical protein